MTTHRKYRAGDWVEVLPAGELLATLDAQGETARLPFMPEMLAFAGRRFRISAIAHKTCDTVNKTGGRAVDDVVHLDDLRCDGNSHGGCQATCLLFWKTAWLRAVEGPAAVEPAAAVIDASRLIANASRQRSDGATIYRCQATTLPEWTRPLVWWDLRQYWRDVASGNVSLQRASATLLLAAVFKLRRLPAGYRLWCWIYDRLHRLLKGQPDPHGHGAIPAGSPTPDLRTDLAPGEIVEINSRDAIFATVNHQCRNRGLQVDEEMTRYCGGRYRVRSRVTQIINESTGEMMHFGNPCIVLDGVDCLGEYADRRLLCPRRITTYWREIWLSRVEAAPAVAASATSLPAAGEGSGLRNPK